MSGSRVGLGFDAHPFADGRPLRLGGMTLPHPRGLAGHSDGDAVLHAIADAILGAAGAGSLGELFPDSDAAWKDADSAALLLRAREAAVAAGLEVSSLDAVIIAESPKVAPHRQAMRDRIAQILEVPAERVSIRGTSSNGLGFPGRGEGIAALAVVLLDPAPAAPNPQSEGK